MSNKLLVVYSQYSDDPVEMIKACEESNLSYALNQIGIERLKNYKIGVDNAWFIGFAIVYSHDMVLNSPLKGECYINHVILKFQKEHKGKRENVEETLYISSVEVFESKKNLKA